MRRLSLTLLCFLVLAGTTASAAYRSEAIGITFPDRLGDFTYQEVHQYPTPGAGISVFYRHGSAVIDVYVYNADQTNIPDGPDSPAVQAQFAGSQNAALQTLRRNHGQATVVHDGSVIRLGGTNGVAFRGSLYQFQSDGSEHRSMLLITGFHGHFIKIRATFPFGGQGDQTRAVTEFLSALGGLLGASAPK